MHKTSSHNSDWCPESNKHSDRIRLVTLVLRCPSSGRNPWKQRLHFLLFSIILNERAGTISPEDGWGNRRVGTRKLSRNDSSYPFPWWLCDLEQETTFVASFFSSIKLEKSDKRCKVAAESYVWTLPHVTIQCTRSCVRSALKMGSFLWLLDSY